MTELKKSRGSCQVPPPPAPIKDSGSLPNGVVPSKPRPPAKPFKLSRALSAGTMTLGKFGKKNAKKNSLQENNMAANEANLNECNVQEDNENAPRKLPGLGSKPVLRKLSFKKNQPQSILESSPVATERELPPVPDTNEDPSQRELPPVPDANGASSAAEMNKRELPPVPDATDRKLPTVPNGSCEEQSSPKYSKETGKKITSVSKPQKELNTQANENGEVGFSPIESTAEEPLVLNGDAKEEEERMTIQTERRDIVTVSNGNDQGKTEMIDEEDVVSECSLSSMENSPEETRRSTSLLAKNDTSISSAEPTTTEDMSGHIDEAGVEYKDFYTIGEIVNSYSYAIPVSMKILQGYCSDTTDVNISTDDVYLLHSVRHSQMVTVRDEDSMMHKIPIDLPIKMGPIYNPKGDYEESLNGYEFKTVSEILSMPSVPKLIYAKQEIVAGEDKNSISEGEVLIVGNTNRSVFKAKRGLKVFSLLTKGKKVILDSSEGLFSTKPSLVRVEFSTFVEYLSQSFPTQVVVYPSAVDESTATAEFPGKSFLCEWFLLAVTMCIASLLQDSGNCLHNYCTFCV